MYIRFPLSLRNVEDFFHERGIDISHETVRYWWNRFGPLFVRETRKKRIHPSHSFFKLEMVPRCGLCRNQWRNTLLVACRRPRGRREQAMLKFMWLRSLQKFASIHAAVHNHFNLERNLSCRKISKIQRNVTLFEWQMLSVA